MALYYSSASCAHHHLLGPISHHSSLFYASLCFPQIKQNDKMNQVNMFSKQIDKKEPVKGGLMSYTLTDLKIPVSYEIRLAPITTYSTGDYVSRTIQYSERE